MHIHGDGGLGSGSHVAGDAEVHGVGRLVRGVGALGIVRDDAVAAVGLSAGRHVLERENGLGAGLQGVGDDGVPSQDPAQEVPLRDTRHPDGTICHCGIPMDKIAT